MIRIHDQEPPVSPDFDPRVADWLEEDPDRAPDPVLQTVLAAFPLIPQRRSPRLPLATFFPNRASWLGATAAIAAVVLGGSLLLFRSGQGNVADASPRPSLAPSPSGPSVGDLTQSYTSSRYGYSIRIPTDWSTAPATASWEPGTVTHWGDSALDVLRGPDARLVIASQPLATGETDDHWFVGYCTRAGAAPDACERYSFTWRQIPVGPSPGFVFLDGAPATDGTILPGGPVYEAVVIATNLRAFEFTLDGAVTRSDFERLLASVEFGPAKSDLSPTASGP